ncbi:MAG: hypothetical protein ACRDE7_10785, partial [Sphingobacterium sp.]
LSYLFIDTCVYRISFVITHNKLEVRKFQSFWHFLQTYQNTDFRSLLVCVILILLFSAICLLVGVFVSSPANFSSFNI